MDRIIIIIDLPFAVIIPMTILGSKAETIFAVRLHGCEAVSNTFHCFTMKAAVQVMQGIIYKH